jgi:hypothetical protein
MKVRNSDGEEDVILQNVVLYALVVVMDFTDEEDVDKGREWRRYSQAGFCVILKHQGQEAITIVYKMPSAS